MNQLWEAVVKESANMLERFNDLLLFVAVEVKYY